MKIERLPLTGLPVDGVPSHVLTCGDPDRATAAAGFLENAELLSDLREYRSFKGSYQGLPVIVCSHGIGSPGAAIAFEEIVAAGGCCIIRIGTCGALQRDIEIGTLIIASAAVSHTGYARETVPPGFPAAAEPRITLALQSAAASSGQPYRTGIVLTRDDFYPGVKTAHTPDYKVMAEANVQAVEMECAALFIVGALRRVQTGAILAVDGNVLESGSESMESYKPRQIVVQQAVETEIQLALAALLALQDDTFR